MSPKRGRAVVLLVEDVELNRDLVVQILEDDFEMLHAPDGNEAVRMVRETLPVIVLMDISLPGMDGLEATRMIKRDPATAHIPVLALTAHAMAGDRERALSAGCDDFLTKPIDEVLLLKKAHEWTDRALARKRGAESK